MILGMREFRRVDSRAPSASLSMRCGSSKRNFTSTSSGLIINGDKMRKKHRNLKKVTVEAEKGGVHRESSSWKAKPVSGHGYMARFKRMREEKMVQAGELALVKSQKLNQGVEERGYLPLKKKRRLRKKYLQCSPDKNESSRDLLLDDEEFCKETSNVDEGRSTMQSVNLKSVKSTTDELALGKSKTLMSYQGIEGDVHSASKKKRRLKKKCLQRPPDRSTGEEHCADPISLWQKPSFESKSAGNNVGGMVNKIQRKIDKRMKKLIKKQKDQIQEFHRVWDDKTSQVDTDHKLEAAMIRTIYGKGSVAMDKLIILDDKFAKKLAKNNIQKDMQLKDIEIEQLAARNKESQMVASWLAKAKGCISDELTSCCKASLIGSQDEEVSGCSKSRKDILCINDAVHFKEQRGENNKLSRNARGKHVVQSNDSDCATATEGGCNAPNGYPINNLLIAEQLSITLQDGDASVVKDQVTVQIEGADSETERLETAASVSFPELVNTAQALQMEVGDMERVEIAASGAVPELVNTAEALQIEAADLERVESGSSFSVSEVVKTAEALQIEVAASSVSVSELANTAQALQMEVAVERIETAASVVVSELVTTAQALQSNIERQEQVEPAVESQCMSRTEATASENLNKTTPVQSSTELQDEDALIINHQVGFVIEVSDSGPADIATPVQSHIDVPEIENCEQLQLMPIDASPSCNQLPSIELESERHSPAAASDNINKTTSVQSSRELQDEDALIVNHEVSLEIEVSEPGPAEIATPVQSHIDSPEIENCEQLQLMPIDASPSHNLLASIELESEGHSPVRNSSGAAEIRIPLQESTSQSVEYAEVPQSNYLDMGRESQSSREASVQMVSSFQLSTEAVLSTVDFLHHDVLQLGGGGLLPSREVVAQNDSSLFFDPLQSELERSNKETEELQKSHDNLMTGLRSEYVKEIREVVAEIQNKYNLKLQDAHAQFSQKNNELIQNHNKILKNKLLADSFRNNHFNFLPNRSLMQQDSPSSSVQHQQHFTPAVAATAPNLHTPILNGQSVHQISVPHYTRVAPTASQVYAAPPVQAARHATAIPSGTARPLMQQDSPSSSVQHQQHVIAPAAAATPSNLPTPILNGQSVQQISATHYTRVLPTASQVYPAPPVQAAQNPSAIPINAIHPTSIPHFQGGIHSSSPNFQPSNSAAASVPPPTWFRFLRNLQPPGIQNPQHVGPPPALPSPPSFGLQHHPLLPGNHTSSIPQTNSSFVFVQQPYFDTLGNPHNAHSNYTSCAPPTNAICLSDDD